MRHFLLLILLLHFSPSFPPTQLHVNIEPLEKIVWTTYLHQILFCCPAYLVTVLCIYRIFLHSSYTVVYLNVIQSSATALLCVAPWSIPVTPVTIYK